MWSCAVLLLPPLTQPLGCFLYSPSRSLLPFTPFLSTLLPSSPVCSPASRRLDGVEFQSKQLKWPIVYFHLIVIYLRRKWVRLLTMSPTRCVNHFLEALLINLRLLIYTGIIYIHIYWRKVPLRDVWRKIPGVTQVEKGRAGNTVVTQLMLEEIWSMGCCIARRNYSKALPGSSLQQLLSGSVLFTLNIIILALYNSK